MNEFERLKKRRETIAKPRHIDLPIPGYGGYLVARYNVVAWDAVSRIAQRAEKAGDSDPRTNLMAQVDLIITACEGLYVQSDNGNHDLVRLTDDNEQPIKYDKRLAENMGFEAGSSREVVVGLFVNDFMISVHHTRLLEWMQSEQDEVDEEFVGESQGPPL